MLTVPPVRTESGLVVFADDADPHAFCVLPTLPTVTAGTLLVYRFSDQDRAEHPDLPVGAGRLDLDVALAAPEARLEALAAEIGAQRWVSPRWRHGRVVLSAPDRPELTTAILDAEPSLLAPTTAIVGAELTAPGVTLMRELLDAPPGGLQLAWELGFDVRLPDSSVRIRIVAEALHQQLVLYGVGDVRTVVRRAAESGLVEVTVTADPVLAEALLPFALATVSEHVEAMFVDAGALRPFDAQRMAFDTVVEAGRVVPWSAGAAGALATDGFASREVDLGAWPFFEDRVMDVRVFAPFGAVDSVEVELVYGDARHTVVARDDRPQRWRTPLQGGPRTVRHRHRVHRITGAGAWSAWEEVDGGAVLLAIPGADRPALSVVASGLLFGRGLRRAVVRATPAGAEAIERALDASTLEATIPGEGPFAVAVRWELDHGGVLDVDEVTVDGDHLLLRDPFDRGYRTVAVVPAGGGWAEGVVAYVDLRRGISSSSPATTVRLDGPDGVLTWRAPIADDAEVEARWTVVWPDGRVQHRAWEAVGGGAVVVGVDGRARWSVRVIPVAVADGERLAVELVADGVPVHTLELADRTPAEWAMPVDGEAPAMTWRAEWTLADGTVVPGGEGAVDTEILVVPARRG